MTAVSIPQPSSPDRSPSNSSPRQISRGLRDVSAMVARELRRSSRSVDSLVSSFAIPVCIMGVFVVVFGGAIERDGSYIGYVVPGVLVLCLGFGSAITAVAVAQDMTSGTINRFKTLPIFAPAVLFGHVSASVLRNVAACVPVLAVALLLGFRPAAGGLDWLAAVAFILLVVVAFTWLSCLVGLVLSVDAAASINFVFLFLPYVSSGFVPVDTMPVWLHGFALHQPFTPIIETLRSLLSGQSPGTFLAPALVWLGAILAISCAAASWVYRRRTSS